MAENPHLAQWRDIRFAYVNNDVNPDTIVLLFDNLETGSEAMRFIKTWKFVTIAFVKKKNNAIDIHLYDDTNPNQYSLIAPDEGKWDREDVANFIASRPNTKLTPVVCGAYVGDDLQAPEPTQNLTVYIPGYVYTDEKNFRVQKLSDRN